MTNLALESVKIVITAIRGDISMFAQNVTMMIDKSNKMEYWNLPNNQEKKDCWLSREYNEVLEKYVIIYHYSVNGCYIREYEKFL